MTISSRARWAGVGATSCALIVACVGVTAFSASAASARSSSANATPRPTLRSLIAPGAKVVRLAKGLEFAEGPVWLAKQGLIVSDVYGNDVVVLDAAGKKRDLRRPSNHANGHALDNAGFVVEAEGGDAAAHRGLITRLAGDGSATVLADGFHGKRFNGPNDLTVKRDGTIWFTDPDFNQNTSVPAIGFNGASG
jgi:sugar lactone lactonase YvrE